MFKIKKIAVTGATIVTNSSLGSPSYGIRSYNSYIEVIKRINSIIYAW